MGTLTITGAGFATLGATPPANWPSTVTFPAGGNPNGSKTYTISDADWLNLLAWMATAQQPQLFAAGATQTPGTPTTPPGPIVASAPQILLAWLQIWINGTISAVQRFMQQPAPVPTPISIQ